MRVEGGRLHHAHRVRLSIVCFSRRRSGDRNVPGHGGSIEIWLGNRLLETLGRDFIFGEMALIDSSPRTLPQFRYGRDDCRERGFLFWSAMARLCS